MENDNLFGEFLREYREANGLSTSDLHRITGVSQPYLSQLENGQKTPSRKVIHRIAAGLKDNLNEDINFASMYKELLNKAGYSTDWKYLEEVNDLKRQKAAPKLLEQAVENYHNNIATPIYLNEDNEGNYYFFKDAVPIPDETQIKIRKMIKTMLD